MGPKGGPRNLFSGCPIQEIRLLYDTQSDAPKILVPPMSQMKVAQLTVIHIYSYLLNSSSSIHVLACHCHRDRTET